MHLFLRSLFLIIYGFLFPIICFGQTFNLLTKINSSAKLANVDNLGNIYVVNYNNELFKYNSSGKLLWNYTQNSFGNMSHIDVSDPFRVILFYEEMQQMVVLNNTLNEISQFSFNTNFSNYISSVTSANNNGFWVYDQLNRVIKKLTNNFIDDLNSGSIYQRDGIDPKVNFMVFNDNYLFLNDKNNAVYLFDRFGNLYKSIIHPISNNFSVEGEQIYFVKENKLVAYNYLTFNESEVILPTDKNPKNVYLKNKLLLILNEKELSLWQVNHATKQSD